MAVLALEEFDSNPVGKAQWYQYYNYADDHIYQQTLPYSVAPIGTVITGVVRLNGTVTVTTSTAHGLVLGDGVTIAGVTDSSFNGEHLVASVPSTTQITLTQAGADTSSSGGTLGPTYPGGSTWRDMGVQAAVRDSVRGTDTLTRSKYIGRDYGTFLSEGLSWLRENFGDKFNDFVSSDFGMMFAKYVAASMDTLAWYMDREVSEWFYALLRLRGRIEELARMSAYKPRPATACTVDETITLDDGPYSFTFTMPKGYQWKGPNDLIFETAQDILWTAGETRKTAQPLIQGITIEESFVSTGEANQVYELGNLPDGSFIAQDSVEFWVDGVQWTIYDYLPFDRLNAVEVIYGATPPYLATGDGVVGNIPAQGASIIVRYVATKGTLGKAAIRGSITDPVIPLVVNGTVISVSGTNPDGASGGEDIEGLEEIRANAPAYFKTADRGVTKQDLTTLTNIFSSGLYGTVAKGKANIVRGIAADIALQTKLAAIDGHKADLETYLTAIATDGTAINASVATVASLRGQVNTASLSIDTKADAVKALVTDGQASLSNALSALDSVPYQEVVGHGDGTGLAWLNVQLEKFPIAPGTVVIWADNQTVEASGSAGDCNTSPGILQVSATPFVAGHAGRSILIGNQMRVITAVVASNQVRYSGAAITGTGIKWEMYYPTVAATDDGNGNIIGSAINTGSSGINYTTGVLNLTLQYALEGTVNYGPSILIQYGYEEQAARSYITEADGKLGDIDSDADDIITLVESIVDSGELLSQIADEETAITASTTDIAAQSVLALGVPDLIEAEVTDLEEYLDEHLSGECKANIVIVQALVTDQDGFYVAPTQALLTALKTDLSQHNVVPTTIATVSGYRNVVAVSMTVRLKIRAPYIYATVQPLVEAAIDDLLKGRDYDEDLYRSDYYNVVVPNSDGVGGVAGVSYANITITGTAFPDPANTGVAPSADSDGNLFVNEDQIITKGTITYSEIV